MSERQPIQGHGYLIRRGLPAITNPMRETLILLRDAKQNGDPHLTLSETHAHTIRALEERDWIVASPPHLGAIRYEITGRGLQALKVYEPMLRRSDGLCPRCAKNPRPVTRSGKVAPYCQECESRKTKRKHLLGIDQKNPEKFCPRCKKRKRYVAASGRVYTYCKHCKNIKGRAEHKRKRKELYKRALAGEQLPCGVKGCDQPRLVYGKSEQSYCRMHYHQWRHEYRRRQAQLKSS